MKAPAVWRRNRVYFYLSFFSAGSQGIITQLFVRRNYAEVKELLLPLILAAGTLAYIAGIRVSGRRLDASVNAAKAMLLLNLVGFVGMLSASRLLPYLAWYCSACFGCNFAYNYLDHRYVAAHREEELTVHVQALLVYQMLAYVLSPLFFAVGSGGRLPTPFIVPAVALVACLPALMVRDRKEEPGPSPDGADPESPREPLSAREAIFLAYSLLFFAIVSIAVSMMAYLLSEFYRFTDFAVKSGVVLTLMSASTVPAILLLRTAETNGPRERGGRNFDELLFRPVLQATIAAASLAMVALLSARLSRSFPYVLAAGAVLGFAYGLFLSSTRRYAGALSRRPGKRRLLTLYNNQQSIASLVGYALTILIWFLTRGRRASFYPIVMAGIMAILALELALIAAWVAAGKRDARGARPIAPVG